MNVLNAFYIILISFLDKKIFKFSHSGDITITVFNINNRFLMRIFTSTVDGLKGLVKIQFS